GDAPPPLQRIGAGSGEQPGDGEAPVDRHDPVANLVGGGVERDGQVGANLEASESLDRRYQTDCGDGDAPVRQVGAELVGQELDGGDDAVEVVQRLAHSHVDQVGDPPAGLLRGEELLGQVDLIDDLGDLEV